MIPDLFNNFSGDIIIIFLNYTYELYLSFDPPGDLYGIYVVL